MRGKCSSDSRDSSTHPQCRHQTGCQRLCLFMRGGEKKKQYTPKPKAWKEERSPPKSKASAPFKQNNSTENRGGGVREETNTNPRAQQALPPQTTSASSAHAPQHSTSPCALLQWGPGAEPSHGDTRQRPAEADSEDPPSGWLGKTKPGGK